MQITRRELNRSFDRVYEGIDDLDDKVNHLRTEFTDFRGNINQKLDTILGHLTEIGCAQ